MESTISKETSIILADEKTKLYIVQTIAFPHAASQHSGRECVESITERLPADSVQCRRYECRLEEPAR